MAVTTPVPDGTDIGEVIAGKLYGRNLLNDTTGADVMGQVTANPAANTLLGRLKDIVTAITTQSAYVDGLEALITTLNGYVDGLETLTGNTNTTLTAISGFVDALETLIGTSNTSLAALAGYVDGLEALAAAATPSGENYIGKTGGDVLTVAGTVPGVTTAAYAIGNVMGGKLTFANATRVAAGSGLVQACALYSKSVRTEAIDLILFNADPTASTLTDHAALVIDSTDVGKIVGVVHLTDWSALGIASIAQALSVGLPFKLPGGTTLYGVLVARAAMTLGSTTDFAPTLRMIPG